MMNLFFKKFSLLCGIMMCCIQLVSAEAGIFNFEKSSDLKAWRFSGKMPGVPRTEFQIAGEPSASDKRVLAVIADRSSGLIMIKIPAGVWKNRPVLKWRWRVMKKVQIPPGKTEPDDQAAGLYFGNGTLVKQRSVSYRWESCSPVGRQYMKKYSMGATTVCCFCLKNQEHKEGEWHEEERNLIQDYTKAFGESPKGDCVLSIGGNSQYTQSQTRAEIDYIYFCPEKPKECKK